MKKFAIITILLLQTLFLVSCKANEEISAEEEITSEPIGTLPNWEEEPQTEQEEEAVIKQEEKQEDEPVLDDETDEDVIVIDGSKKEEESEKQEETPEQPTRAVDDDKTAMVYPEPKQIQGQFYILISPYGTEVDKSTKTECQDIQDYIKDAIITLEENYTLSTEETRNAVMIGLLDALNLYKSEGKIIDCGFSEEGLSCLGGPPRVVWYVDKTGNRASYSATPGNNTKYFGIEDLRENISTSEN